ncbi:MAG: hypothetical protein AAF933_12430 [Pseudomonadota bacterium]
MAEHRTHANSLFAYAETVDALPAKRREVYVAIRRLGLATRQTVAKEYSIPLNAVCGRVHELIEAGLVRECGNSIPRHKGEKPRALLSVVKPTEYVQPAAPPPKATTKDPRLLSWAEQTWHREVGARPLSWPLRRTIDTVLRDAIRSAGVDDRELVGPTHDELKELAKSTAVQPELLL